MVYFVARAQYVESDSSPTIIRNMRETDLYFPYFDLLSRRGDADGDGVLLPRLRRPEGGRQRAELVQEVSGNKSDDNNAPSFPRRPGEHLGLKGLRDESGLLRGGKGITFLMEVIPSFSLLLFSPSTPLRLLERRRRRSEE